MHSVKLTLTKSKDCHGSVRFDAPKGTQGDGKPWPIKDVYVSRATPGVNEAQSITVTIEVP